MLSWIFRHRARLQAIYGQVAPPPLCGERFKEQALAPGVSSGDRGPTRPGRLRRTRGGAIEVGPMPPRGR